jgi:hypothetical protein
MVRFTSFKGKCECVVCAYLRKVPCCYLAFGVYYLYLNERVSSRVIY